jgi:hypothetical protein
LFDAAQRLGNAAVRLRRRPVRRFATRLAHVEDRLPKAAYGAMGQTHGFPTLTASPDRQDAAELSVYVELTFSRHAPMTIPT